MTKKIAMRKILRRNRKVDEAVLKGAERLHSDLKRLGLEPRSGYNLAPPLGGKIVRDQERRIAGKESRSLGIIGVDVQADAP
jgi:hypothetical protein